MTSRDWENLLLSAMQAEIGIMVKTNDSSRARAKFHRIRQEMQDPFLDQLEFRLVSETRLMICHPRHQTPDTRSRSA